MADLLALDGNLYGTTTTGGQTNNGIVFKVAPTGAETVLHVFQGAPNDGGYSRAPLTKFGGILFGTTANGGVDGRGTLFSITPNGIEAVIRSFGGGGKHGHTPMGGLIAVGGRLYGTTIQGGPGVIGNRLAGTVYSVDPVVGTNIRVLHSFAARTGRDGRSPVAKLLDVGGSLIGTTTSGGKYKLGTVFKVDR